MSGGKCHGCHWLIIISYEFWLPFTASSGSGWATPEVPWGGDGARGGFKDSAWQQHQQGLPHSRWGSHTLDPFTVPRPAQTWSNHDAIVHPLLLDSVVVISGASFILWPMLHSPFISSVIRREAVVSTLNSSARITWKFMTNRLEVCPRHWYLWVWWNSSVVRLALSCWGEQWLVSCLYYFYFALKKYFENFSLLL